ncbi:MAG: glycosyltransferase family 4 protein [Aestuariivirga sp.]|nr:glycosyltransferase family 4 protein [Aestuariivirga sp.]
MRIGYFIPGWPPDKVPNGIVATLGRLSEALEQLGHEVFFLTPHLADNVSDPRVLVITPQPARGLLDRLRWKFDFERIFYDTSVSVIRAQLLKLISDRKIEIFQMEETYGWVNTVAKNLPIPIVTRLHGPWFTYAGIVYSQTPPKRDIKRIDREGLAIRSALAVTAPSNAVLQSTRDFYGEITPLCKVIPNPMPLAPPEKDWNYQSCDKSTILFVGRFDEHKGGDIVLRAFSELVKLRPNLRLIFVGPDRGVRLKNGRFVRFAEFVQTEVSSEATARINYLGALPRSEIDSLRQTAAMTIVASRYENFPNTVSESMSIGAPIVATSVGGIPELLESERSAILIEPNSPGALFSACLRLLDNPQLAIELAAQAKIDCSNRYSPEKIAKQTVDFYAEVIDQFSQRKRLE